MTVQSTTGSPTADLSRRKHALAAGLGLLLMAVLAPIAQFGILKTLIVPSDSAITVANIAASIGSFWAAVAAFFAIAILDVVVAWGLFGLLRSADERLARIVAGLRIVYAVGFGIALLSLFHVAQLVSGASPVELQSTQLRDNVASSLASFDRTWDLALVIFGLHLVGLGVLVAKFGAPRLLALLVVVSGIGYLIDSMGRLFVPGYTLSLSVFTFIGEALLIVWLLWIAAKGVRLSGRSQSPAILAVAPESVE